MSTTVSKTTFTVMGLMLLFCVAAFGKNSDTGRLKVTVSPPETYTFVDGQAIGPGNHSIKVTSGSRHLVFANHGYKFVEQDVQVDPDKTVPLNIHLEPAGAEVSGPRGRIQIEVGRMHAGDAAVFLNGKTPAYFVGHVDEFNNDIGWHQELIVPPGTHQVTVGWRNRSLWSGSVAVAADQRVIVNISNGKQVTKAWPRGEKELPAAIPRFKANTASATVAIAPVTATVSATPTNIKCGEKAQVAWNSIDAVDTSITNLDSVANSGDTTVSPRQTTMYELTARGPGGEAKAMTQVDVNPVVEASLSASPTEARYRRIGDKVLEQGSSTLNWSSSNANNVAISQLGSSDSGTKTVTLTPNQTSNGPVDEQITYTLTATNECGGSSTKTVAVHVTGSIDPTPEMLLSSVFFPTDYPNKEVPSLGLVRSQQDTLKSLAEAFNKYLDYDPNATLSLGAYADKRGSDKYNKTLSEMRAQRVKDFLVSQGVASEKINTSVYGKQDQLDKSTVADLQKDNPNPPPDVRSRNLTATWLAYNRRVDIVLLPNNTQSDRFYPNQVGDSHILWQRSKPESAVVEQNN